MLRRTSKFLLRWAGQVFFGLTGLVLEADDVLAVTGGVLMTTTTGGVDVLTIGVRGEAGVDVVKDELSRPTGTVVQEVVVNIFAGGV